jgi:hypothetical protein
VTADFTLDVGEKIFTIGSCFARNVEKRLAELGFEIPAMAWAKSAKDLNAPSEFLNKYVVRSILQELRWALDPAHPFPDPDGFIELSEGHWHDPHYTEVVDPAPIELVRARRARATEIMREVASCRTVVITLGYVEVWRDNKSGLLLNSFPPLAAMKREPGRFTIEILSFDEINADLEAIYELLERYCPKDFRILITVSPVPLARTFSEMDVITANTYSKSVQRAAVEQFRRRHANVGYFPSYESVILTDRAIAYEEDQRHVTKEIVAMNMAHLVKNYCKDTSGEFARIHADSIEKLLGVGALRIAPESDTGLFDQGVEAYGKKQWRAAIRLMEASNEVNNEKNRKAPYYLAVAHHEVGNWLECMYYARKSIGLNSGWAPIWLLYARAAAQEGLREKAAAACTKALELDPGLNDAADLLNSVS